MRHPSSFWRATEVKNQPSFHVSSPLEVNWCGCLPWLETQEPMMCHPVLWDLWIWLSQMLTTIWTIFIGKNLGVTVRRTSAVGSNALESRGPGSLALPQGAGTRSWRRRARAAVDSRWENWVLFLLQEWSLELSSLVTPHNSRWLQIYYCIFPNLEGFHFWPHKRKKLFPFLSMASIFYSETKSIRAMPGNTKHLIIFPKNSFEFCNRFSLDTAHLPASSRRNCLQDSWLLKDNDGSVFPAVVSHIIDLICNHSWRPIPWITYQLSSACMKALYFTPWQLLQSEAS